MKICFVGHFYSFTGNSIGNVVLRTAHEFSKNDNNDVTVLIPAPLEKPARFESSPLRIVNIDKRFKTRGGFDLKELIFNCNFLLKNNFDVIYFYRGHRPSSFIPSLLIKIFKKATVVEEWWERYDFKGIGKTRKGLGLLITLYDTLFELPTKYIYDGTICINSYLYNRIPRKRQKVVLRGASEANNIHIIEKIKAKNLLALDPNQLYIGLSNVDINDLNDLKVFVEAYKEAKPAGISFLITGENSERIKNYFQDSKTQALGWVTFENYSLFLSACDLFYLPFPDTERNRGRWPNKIGDYVAAKKSIISNPTGEILEFSNEFRGIFKLIGNTKKEYLKLFNSLSNDNFVESNLDTNKDIFEKGAKTISFGNRIDNLTLFFNGLK